MEKYWTVIKMVYSLILRPVLYKAIDDPDSQIDDLVMKLLDNLFEYNE